MRAVTVATLSGVSLLLGACGSPSAPTAAQASDSRSLPDQSDRSVLDGTIPAVMTPSSDGTTPNASAIDPPPPASSPTTTFDTERFTAVNQALAQRVRASGVGGYVLIASKGATLHEHSVGGVTRTTSLGVASAAKWLTAATLLTFVDEGMIGLDDPVLRWLPEFSDGSGSPITVRHLLTHTAGIPDPSWLWEGSRTLVGGVQEIARGPRQFEAGSRFTYGNADYYVAGRLIEVLGGADFASVFRRRIGAPLGMGATSWPGAPSAPSPAAGAVTTAEDYSRFLQLLLDEGVRNGNRILSVASVAELMRNQVANHDLSGDYAVGITKIPRYTLGGWPDVVDGAGTGVIVSGNGGRGYYPWIDRSTGSFGIVAVQDDRGATVAVPASQLVAAVSWNAVRD